MTGPKKHDFGQKKGEHDKIILLNQAYNWKEIMIFYSLSLVQGVTASLKPSIESSSFVVCKIKTKIIYYKWTVI